MTFYAHAAEAENGNLLPEKHWQLLSAHLRNDAEWAKGFAAPFGLVDEAEMAGLPHLTASEFPEAQRFSVSHHQNEFSIAKANGYIYQPAKE